MFQPDAFVAEQLALLKQQIQGPAVIATSGGVDSTVAAALVAKAIHKDLHCVFVDTGYMRKGEPQAVDAMLKGMGVTLHHIDARQEFYGALKGITDPERKRKVIGEKFIRIFERVAKEQQAEYLVQGTIAPDWIESGGELRDTIKSHHNVGGLPADMHLKLVEPLRDLYKDEVRALARHLRVPVSERQPFPGPGLAIRVLGEATPERTEVVREACAIVEEEIEAAVKAGKMERPWQYFAALLPVKSVGVHGDLRAYGETIVVRAVGSLDAMSAHYSPIPHDVLERISVRITNQLGQHVNRVVYDVTHKPPGTVEWE
ncbi:MAG TPA: glutamine-hydrolyzing GMP synthase [Candidatus Thermoplasmatota archaeon]|jgi:GMP synthase (glutamine-hydrolysing)|nr:glutamine-hydrolyzing GMP synthase [Candidatus Thermoplasmatota archaeon]